MAGKGPPKTPTKILDMRGSWRAKTRKAEPVPVAQRLTCPAWLDAEGKRVWRTLTKHLQAMGVVGAVDSFAVGRYCTLWVRWHQAEEAIKTQGTEVSVVNSEGEVTSWRLAPAVKVAGDLADKLLRLEQQYGMTAAARASLSIAPETKGAQQAQGPDKTRFFTQRG